MEDRPASSDVANKYWKRERSREIKVGPTGIVSAIARDGPPDEGLSRGCRVAITEFSVEFVDTRVPNPFAGPVTIRSLSARVFEPARPVAPGTAPGDVGAIPTAIAASNEIETARALCEGFEKCLRDNSLIVIPHETVTACASYARLHPAPSVKSSWATPFLRTVATDTGIVFRTHTVAAPGLGVATCSATALASAEAQIRRDTNADIVMQVNLRVGTYHGSAAMEQNSTIRWTSTNGQIVLTAQKSLVSNADAAPPSPLITEYDEPEPMEHSQFVGQLEAILPTFIGLAFPSMPKWAGDGDPFARAGVSSGL